MKLFVDDMRPAPEGWHLARTITEAVRVLARGDVEEVSLDHDIFVSFGGPYDTPIAPWPETYEAVAWFIAQMPDKPELVTLHTWNHGGANVMRGILEKAGVRVLAKPSKINPLDCQPPKFEKSNSQE